jgi:hypothetical protein
MNQNYICQTDFHVDTICHAHQNSFSKPEMKHVDEQRCNLYIMNFMHLVHEQIKGKPKDHT